MGDGWAGSPAGQLAGDILDDDGNLLISPRGDGQAGGFGPGLRRYITSGVYNGDFAMAPPAPSSNISASNPLPFWTFTQASGVAVTASLVEDSSAASGNVLRFRLGEGVAGDDSYIEQIVPVNGSRARSFTYSSVASFVTGSTVSDAVMYVATQFLTAGGSTTGSAGSTEWTTTSTGTSTLRDVAATAGDDGQIPTDAYYLRIRVGFKRGAAATTVTESVTVTEVRLNVGREVVLVTEGTDPTNYGPASIFQNNGQLFVAANQGGSSGSSPALVLVGQASSGTLQFVNVDSVALPNGTSDPTTADAFARWRTDRDALLVGDGTRARLVGSVGWVPYAFPIGVGPEATATTARALAANGGAVQVPILVPGHMLLYSVTVRNTDTTLARSFQWRLYEWRSGSSATGDEIANANGSASFTAAAAANRDADAQSPPVYIGPGTYMLVIRNTHATNTFGIGEQAGGTIGVTTAKTKTLGSTLGSTLDLVTSWSSISSLLGVVLRGQVPGGSGYY